MLAVFASHLKMGHTKVNFSFIGIIYFCCCIKLTFYIFSTISYFGYGIFSTILCSIFFFLPFTCIYLININFIRIFINFCLPFRNEKRKLDFRSSVFFRFFVRGKWEISMLFLSHSERCSFSNAFARVQLHFFVRILFVTTRIRFFAVRFRVFGDLLMMMLTLRLCGSMMSYRW